MIGRTKGLAVGALAATAVLLGSSQAQAAQAVEPANDTFSVCVEFICSTSYTQGGIDWHNRSATVQGFVFDAGTGHTTAYFDAFAGSTKIDSETRTVSEGRRDFNFGMGVDAPPGGINRIRIQVCLHNGSTRYCSAQYNYLRD